MDLSTFIDKIDLNNFDMENLLELLSPAALATLGALIAIPFVYYTLECFFGYQIFRIKCAVMGFAAGFSTGMMIATLMNTEEGMHVVIGLLAGISFAFLAIKVYKFGVFYTTAVTVFTLIYAGVSAAGDMKTALIASVVCAFVAGMVAVFFIKKAIIVSSAFNGGTGLATCVFALFSFEQPLLLFVAGIGLCVLGAMTQFKSSKHMK